jgi:hypothetical protein
MGRHDVPEHGLDAPRPDELNCQSPDAATLPPDGAQDRLAVMRTQAHEVNAAAPFSQTA